MGPQPHRRDKAHLSRPTLNDIKPALHELILAHNWLDAELHAMVTERWPPPKVGVHG